MSRNKKVWVLLVAFVLGMSTMLSAQVPDKPNPPRLVNDLAGIFSPQQAAVLEDSLARFAKKTSNQVTIVTVNDLVGMDAAQFAYEIGEKWGVGGKELNNGVVILVKPKTETKGQAFIATGYGVEGVLPDAACSRIINNEMIPEFKRNDYYAGIVKALNVILPVLAKEYSIEEYQNEDLGAMMKGFLLAIGGLTILCVIFYLIDRDNKNNNDRDGNSGTFGGGRRGSDVATAILLGSMLGGGRSSGHSGGSFGGGGFGGFGGFGGGSFGGGGAGGSW